MSVFSSIASAVGIKSTANPEKAALGEWDVETGAKGVVREFQYFPDGISDNRDPNYASHGVPGGSHHIFTFIDGGNREIAFDAIFTQDQAPPTTGLSGLVGFLTGSKEFFAKDDPRTVDIGAAIAWLRGFTYPSYDVDGLSSPPPPCVVYLPNSGIIGTGKIPDSFIGVMTACNVKYESFHRNGAPRIAVVSLAFKEIVQINKNWQFYGAEQFRSVGNSYNHVKAK